MGPIEEGMLALLCAVGAASLIGLFFAWLVRPMRGDGLLAVLPAQGDGEALEGTLRLLSWLRRAGLFPGEAVIWDAGLTSQGRELALRLALRWPWVTCCPRGALDEWLEQ